MSCRSRSSFVVSLLFSLMFDNFALRAAPFFHSSLIALHSIRSCRTACLQLALRSYSRSSLFTLIAHRLALWYLKLRCSFDRQTMLQLVPPCRSAAVVLVVARFARHCVFRRLPRACALIPIRFWLLHCSCVERLLLLLRRLRLSDSGTAFVG